ncbi:terminase TerL endonuclease subunit [Bradyrhizobium sp. NP1]|uniref:terminase large subunit n=1 Tax=Bradyrhizobium sp. NP1 TaxID=3049772 RepID=UPI0025A5905F|nr:terminase TerL endonuclease subunit [Bradyrhizobium sp. NP1]WJR76015.1 terminase large subunit [Bradyrhizobium sp. NP1]
MTIRSPSKDTFPHWIYDNSPIPDPMEYGERAVSWLRRLRHPKSRLPDKAFQLDEWQERIVRRIYGPRDECGNRIVSTVVILVPRGNRKTSLSAALALLHTFGPEHIPGGEVIFAASDRKQAGIAFKEAIGIVKAHKKKLLPYAKIYDAFNSAKKISYPREGVELEVISSDAPSQEGRTPAFVLADEIHVWRGDLLWKVLTNGLDKTDNTLLIVATTAGRGQENIAHDVVDRARKIACGEIDDPSLLPVLFEADPDCDYTDEDLWRRVNPGSAHGYPSIDGFRRHVARAKNSPTERASLLQYKLNVWLDHSTSPFVDMATYDLGADPIDYEAFNSAPCWIGVDMSKTTDLSAVVACFRNDDIYTVLPHFFCPEEDILRRGDVDGVNYASWAKQGFLTATPGNVIDNSAVENYIRGLCERFNVREIGFDNTYAQAVTAPLMNDGYRVVTIRQGWVTQSPALNVLEAAIIAGKFRHGGNPVLRWNFSNVAIHKDSNDNRVMHKSKSTDRIDGASATWMAVSRAAASEGPSVFDDPNLDPEYFVLA